MRIGLAVQKGSAPGSGGHSRLDDRGYIMAVLLIGMAITAVWLSASLPAWRQQAQREKEMELIFRGEQYARAIALFYTKNNSFPTDIDTLVSQHYLRKKWKDPITNDDFALVIAGQPAPGTGSSAPAGGRPTGPGTSAPVQQTPGAARGTSPGGASPQGQFTGGGIMGVTSKSKATSIKIYGTSNAQEYDLWYFDCNSAARKLGRLTGCVPLQQGQPQPGRGGTPPTRGGNPPTTTPPGRGGGRGLF